MAYFSHHLNKNEKEPITALSASNEKNKQLEAENAQVKAELNDVQKSFNFYIKREEADAAEAMYWCRQE